MRSYRRVEPAASLPERRSRKPPPACRSVANDHLPTMRNTRYCRAHLHIRQTSGGVALHGMRRRVDFRYRRLPAPIGKRLHGDAEADLMEPALCPWLPGVMGRSQQPTCRDSDNGYSWKERTLLPACAFTPDGAGKGCAGNSTEPWWSSVATSPPRRPGRRRSYRATSAQSVRILSNEKCPPRGKWK
jgi:hypothetical protein